MRRFNTRVIAVISAVIAVIAVLLIWVSSGGIVLGRDTQTAVQSKQGQVATAEEDDDGSFHIAARDIVDSLDKAAGISDVTDEGIISMGATPSYTVDTKGRKNWRTIRNEDDVPLKPGTYRLSTYCHGSGKAKNTFVIGDKTQSTLQSCGGDPYTTATQDIDVTGSGLSVVSIEPVHNASYEIAYRIERIDK
ncbi:hypothetical protein [Bifidobacterium leontopitheci]|uniref:Uncharacterized protein n=1 Tax=Bifidobacterium leontopitheci TaxID=2650774 RepID=A0A6I1GPT5_9BIFI|nr:hypothetical protein [Bifidobacterium leontopitheci]KAB7791297.1 hypothetical protein F7D09_0250 [Bifidobacterium leontopitheci]